MNINHQRKNPWYKCFFQTIAIKRVLQIFGLVILCNVAYAQHSTHKEIEDHEGTEFHHCYFEERSFSAGGSLPYSFEAEAPGINVRLYYNIGENICFGPEFSYFKTEAIAIQDFNFIGHYIFETPWVGVYPLVGGNYTVESDGHETENALGLVLGGGLHRNFHRITVFAEYAHVKSHLKDDFLSLGCLFNFK